MRRLEVTSDWDPLSRVATNLFEVKIHGLVFRPLNRVDFALGSMDVSVCRCGVKNSSDYELQDESGFLTLRYAPPTPRRN